MSFANFDEIRRICCEFEEDPVVKIQHLEHLELFPEGHMLEERLLHYNPFPLREKNLPLLRLIPAQEEEAVYMIRYGQLV